VRRVIAAIEVLLAFVLCRLTYRSLQHTVLGRWEQAVGQNFLPGLVLMASGVARVWVHQRGSRNSA
jgi:hypothetical protein